MQCMHSTMAITVCCSSIACAPAYQQHFSAVGVILKKLGWFIVSFWTIRDLNS